MRKLGFIIRRASNPIKITKTNEVISLFIHSFLKTCLTNFSVFAPRKKSKTKTRKTNKGIVAEVISKADVINPDFIPKNKNAGINHKEYTIVSFLPTFPIKNATNVANDKEYSMNLKPPHVKIINAVEIPAAKAN